MKKKTAVAARGVPNLTSVLAKGPKSNKELRTELGLPTEEYDPKLDRELQRLRKAGKLRLLNGRWALNTTHVCEACKGRGWVLENSSK